MKRGSKGAIKELKAIGRVFSDAFQQAQQSESIVLARRRFREIHEAKGPGNDGVALEGEARDAGEKRTPQEEERGHFYPDLGQLKGSLPDSY